MDIRLTDKARTQFLEVIKAQGREGHGLRVVVRHANTPEPEFSLNFVDPAQAQPDDVVVDGGGFNVYMDPGSAKFLDDATVDFVDNLSESGFKVDAPHAGIPRPEGAVADALQKILEEKINPGVASHGGHVALVAVEDDTAYLRFAGGCQGCGMVNVTLKQGVEKVILAEVPAITRVLDITDHAAGTNPYYRAEE